MQQGVNKKPHPIPQLDKLFTRPVSDSPHKPEAKSGWNDDDVRTAKRYKVSSPCYCTTGISRLLAASAMEIPGPKSFAPDNHGP